MFRRRNTLERTASSIAAMTSGVSAEDVLAAIEVVLGRTPDKALVDYHLSLGFRNRIDLGRYLQGTEEFKQRSGGKHRQPIFLGDRVLASTHRGEPIYTIPEDLDVTPGMLFSGMFEPHVERVIKGVVREGEIAIDIGANVGYHTLAIAAAVGPNGKVHAFEASPAVMRLFKATMVLNGYTSFRGHGRVTVHAMAASDKTGTLILEQAPGHFGSGHLVTEDPRSDFGPEYSTRAHVPAVAIDEYLGHTVDQLGFLHMDIEGAEPLAMKGMKKLLDRSPSVRIVREWSVHMMSSLTDVCAHITDLEEQAFRFWLIRHDGSLGEVASTDLLHLDHCDLLISRTEPPAF